MGSEFLLYNFLMWIAMFCLMLVQRKDFRDTSDKNAEEVKKCLETSKSAIALVTVLLTQINNTGKCVLNNNERYECECDQGYPGRGTKRCGGR